MATKEDVLAEIARRQAAPTQAEPAPQLQGATMADVQAEFQRRGLQAPQFQVPSREVLGFAPETFAQGVREAITGEQRQTPQIAGLPEFRETPEAQSFQVAAGLLTTFDPQQQINIIQEAIPEAQIEADERGNVIIDIAGQRSVLNQPGFSRQDFNTAIANVLSFIPAGRIAGLASGLAARLGFGAAGAAATQTGLRAATQQLGGGEEVLSPEGLREIATAGVLGGAAEAVVPGIQAFRTGRAARQAGVAAEELGAVAPAIREAQEAAQATRVPLFQAQQTLSPAQLEKQAFIGQLPAGTQRTTAALRSQNEAAATAVEDFLGQIAPPEAVVTGAERFRTASQRAVQAAKDIRTEKASPLFEEAFAQGAKADLKPVTDLISESIKDFPKGGEVEKTLRRVNRLVSGEDKTLRQLHNAKLEIDQILSKFGENSLGNTTKRQVTAVKDSLLTQMDEASDLYRTARETFATESPTVTKLQDSIVGKIATIDDIQLKNISRRIFDPTETNPQTIRQAKKIVQDVDPGAWDELLRGELERRIGGIRADITAPGVTIENLPGQLERAIFGNAKQRRVLFSAVDGETSKNLKYLETVLGRAKLGRPGGSQTAAREEIKRELRGGTVQSLREFFRKPISSLISTGEDAAFNRRVRSLANALFDTTWKPQMRNIRKLGTKNPAAARALTQLLDDVNKSIEGEQ